jgi:hypothetical protein
VTVTARFGLLATMAHQLFFFLAIMYPMTQSPFGNRLLQDD